MLQGVFDEGEAEVLVRVGVQEAGGEDVGVVAQGSGGRVCGEEGETLQGVGEGVVVEWLFG